MFRLILLLFCFESLLAQNQLSLYRITENLDTIPYPHTSLDSAFLWDPIWHNPFYFYYLGQIGKPYLKYVYGIPSRFIKKKETFFNEFSSNEYLYIQSQYPYLHSSKLTTKVRFDQSSRKTQLLDVLVNSPLKKGKGNISGFYNRKTSEGAYLNSFTDHYLLGATSMFSLWHHRLRIGLRWAFAQVTDGINGGTLLSSDSPFESHFNKSGTPIALSSSYRSEKLNCYEPELIFTLKQQNNWYAHLEGTFQFELFEHLFSIGNSTAIYPDSSPFQKIFGFLQDTLTNYEFAYQLQRNRITTSLLNKFQFLKSDSSSFLSLRWTLFHENRQWKGEQFRNLTHEQRYGLHQYIFLHWKKWNFFNNFTFEKNSLFPSNLIQYESKLQFQNLNLLHGFQKNFPPLQDVFLATPFFTPLFRDTTKNIQVNYVELSYFWKFLKQHISNSVSLFYSSIKNEISYTQYAHPYQDKTNKQNVGIIYKVTSIWSFLKINLYSVFYLQRATPYFPQYNGTIQLGWNYLFHDLQNHVFAGIQITGFSSYNGLYFNPVTEIFFPATTYLIEPYYRVDLFAVLEIQKRFKAYLFLYHLNEKLSRPGYFTVPLYPMLERSFSFGVEWLLFQ